MKIITEKSDALLRTVAAGAALLLAACAPGFQERTFPLVPPLRPPMSGESQFTPVGEAAEAPRTRFVATPTSPAGATVLAGETASFMPAFKSGQPISINVENLPLPAFINEVYGNILGLNFQIDKTLQAKTDLVTLRVSEPQTPQQIYKLARQVLENYGVAILVEGELLRFLLAAAGAPKGGEPPLVVSGRSLPSVPDSHRPIFQLVPLTVLRTNQVKLHLSKIFNFPQLEIIEEIEQNALMVFGPPALVAQAVEAIRFLDRPFMRGRYSLRIDPSVMNPEQLAGQLVNILKTEGYSAEIGARTSSSVSILPVAPLNALFVFTADQQVLEHVKQWAVNLDTPGHSASKSGLFFYPVQNTQAKNLAEVLNPLLNSGGIQALPGETPAPVALPAPGAAAGQAPPAATPAPQTPSARKLSIDPLRNALIFQGDSQEWAYLLPVLREMDKPAKLVLVEVTIAEVTLTDEERFGVEWLLGGVDASMGDYQGNLGTYKGLGLGGGGLAYTLVNSLGQTRAILNAFAGKGRVNVLSSPRIMVKSGEDASINIGTEVPILTSQSVDPAAPQQDGNTAIMQQIQYRRTGVILKVKPVVHSGNRIDLEVSQEISKAESNTTSAISSPSILNRQIETKLSLSDGGSVLLGGLISSSMSNGSSSVPVLGDIPVLGHLFRTDTQNTERTELIVLIVPYIINNAEEAREITESFRRQLDMYKETVQN